MSKKARGGRNTTVRGRARGGRTGPGVLFTVDVDSPYIDDDDMPLVGGPHMIGGGSNDSGALDSVGHLSNGNGANGGMALNGVDFGNSIDNDPFGSFTSIGSLSNDPLGNMASMSDPFMDMGGVTLNQPDIDISLIPTEPPEMITAKPAKNKGGRKPKSKADANSAAHGSSSYLNGPSASPSNPSVLPTAPLTLLNFAFHSSPTPIFNKLGLSVPNSGTTAHLTSVSKSLLGLSSDDLAALARELAAMGRDARQRASRAEIEARKLGVTSEIPSSLPSTVQDIPDELILNNHLAQLLSVATEFDPPDHQPKRKRADEDGIDASPAKPGYAGSTGKNQQPSKKKKLNNTNAANKKGNAATSGTFESEDEDDDDGYNTDGDNPNPKKKKKSGAMTEKEKQRQIASFWLDVDEHFSFPTPVTLQPLKPKLQHELSDYAIGKGSDAAFKIPPAGEHWKDVWDRQREEEREKSQKEKERTQGTANGAAQMVPSSSSSPSLQPTSVVGSSAAGIPPSGSSGASKKKPTVSHPSSKKTLSTALLQMGLDASKLKKVLLDTDKALGGDKTFYDPSKQTLAMRLMSMMIETPNGTPRMGHWSNGPATATTTTSSKKAAATQQAKDAAAGATTNATGGTTQPPPPPPAKKKPMEYSLEKRIEMELKYIGLFSGSSSEYSYGRELSDRTDDDLCASLRVVQKELSQTLNSMNLTRVKLYPHLSKLTGHNEKMTQLLEAETQLNKIYMQRNAATTGKKKTLSNLHTGYNLGLGDAAIERALDQWNTTIRSTGTRREITSFIPDPYDLGGIPRFRLNEYPPFRSYLDILENGIDPPMPEPRDADGRLAWKHDIPPHHPHNPNYQPPPPPSPPPTITQSNTAPVDHLSSQQYGRGERGAHASLGSALDQPLTSVVRPSPSVSSSSRKSSSTQPAHPLPPQHVGAMTNIHPSNTYSHAPPPPTSSHTHTQQHAHGSNQNNQQFQYQQPQPQHQHQYQQSSHGSSGYPTKYAPNMPSGSHQMPPQQRHQQQRSDGSYGSNYSQNTNYTHSSSSYPNHPSSVPRPPSSSSSSRHPAYSHPYSSSSGGSMIGALPPMTAGGYTGDIGMAEYGHNRNIAISHNDANMQHHPNQYGHQHHSQPHHRPIQHQPHPHNIGVNSSLSIGTLPPKDAGYGLSTSQDFFGMEDFS